MSLSSTEAFLHTLEDLSGKTAVVTGGTQGIGQQTVLLLALKKCTVYICALNEPKDQAGLASLHKQLAAYPPGSVGVVHFHFLDLLSIKGTQRSVDQLKSKIGDRLDILIANAGTAFPTLDKLSIDGYERTFAVNCLGHFVFVTSLLPVIEKSAELHGEARVTITSSQGYIAAKKLDYVALQTAVPNDGASFRQLSAAYQRYLDSKLAVLYFALELAKRTRAKGCKNVFINACHPGQSPKTALGDGQQPVVWPWMEKAIKFILGLFMRQSPQDSAKTQVFLAASKVVREQDVNGQYWLPQFSWSQRYLTSRREELKTTLASNEGEWQRLWEFCEEAVKKATTTP